MYIQVSVPNMGSPFLSVQPLFLLLYMQLTVPMSGCWQCVARYPLQGDFSCPIFCPYSVFYRQGAYLETKKKFRMLLKFETNFYMILPKPKKSSLC